MIDFKPLDPAKKSEYDHFLLNCGQRGCEYNFANLFLWGRQRAAFLGDNLVFFSQFNRRSVYLFPLYHDDPKPVLDAVIEDAAQRGIPCRLTSLLQEDCALLERLYPGKFRIHVDRDSFDYVYAIDDLSQLKGRKFQRKRNHLNRFRQTCPDYTVVPISPENTNAVTFMLEDWYAAKLEGDPLCDLCMEQIAIQKALRCQSQLEMDGLALYHEGKILAMTMGTPLADNSYDIHFEKASDDGAYAAINYEFANYLHQKYPHVQWLNREDDLGLEGLRKAKLSYNPDHLIEKYWACLLEDGYDY